MTALFVLASTRIACAHPGRYRYLMFHSCASEPLYCRYRLQSALGSGTLIDWPVVYNVTLCNIHFTVARFVAAVANSAFSPETSVGKFLPPFLADFDKIYSTVTLISVSS
jgi:hypothetical protein